MTLQKKLNVFDLRMTSETPYSGRCSCVYAQRLPINTEYFQSAAGFRSAKAYLKSALGNTVTVCHAARPPLVTQPCIQSCRAVGCLIFMSTLHCRCCCSHGWRCKWSKRRQTHFCLAQQSDCSFPPRFCETWSCHTKRWTSKPTSASETGGTFELGRSEVQTRPLSDLMPFRLWIFSFKVDFFFCPSCFKSIQLAKIVISWLDFSDGLTPSFSAVRRRIRNLLQPQFYLWRQGHKVYLPAPDLVLRYLDESCGGVDPAVKCCAATKTWLALHSASGRTITSASHK